MRTRLAVLLAAVLALGACASSDSNTLDAYAAEAEARASDRFPSATDDPGPDLTDDAQNGDEDPSIDELARSLNQPRGLYGTMTVTQARCAAQAIVASIEVEQAIDLVEGAQAGEPTASVFESEDIARAIVDCADYRKIFRESMARLYPANFSQVKCFGDRAPKETVRGVLQLDYLPLEQFTAVSDLLDQAFGVVGGCLYPEQIREHLSDSAASTGYSAPDAACYADNMLDLFGAAEAFRVHFTMLDLNRPDAETYVSAIEDCVGIRQAFFQNWIEPGDPEGLDDCVSDALTDSDLRRLYTSQFSEQASDDADDELLDEYYTLLDRCYDEAEQGT